MQRTLIYICILFSILDFGDTEKVVVGVVVPLVLFILVIALIYSRRCKGDKKDKHTLPNLYNDDYDYG